MVAGAFILLLIMMLCTFVLDISYYFYQKQQLQSVTESAALAGAQALNQYKDNPNEAAAYKAALETIRNRQGDAYADLYEVHSPTNVDGIKVWKVNKGSGSSVPCKPDFEIENGSIQMNESTQVHAEIVGSAIEYWGPDFTGDYVKKDGHVTVQLKLSSPDGDQVIEPWGNYEDPGSGNVNKSDVEDYDLNDVSPGTKIDVRARSYLWHDEDDIPPNVEYSEEEFGSVEPWIQAATDNQADTQQVFTLKDGQQVPDLDGFGDQASMEDFAEPYLNDQGEAQLKPNQAIVFFELTHKDASDTGFDNQDLVVLISLKSESNYSGQGPNVAQDSNNCGGPNTSYRVGVLGKDVVEPLVLPSWMLGWTEATSRNGTRIFHTAVAGLGPQKMGGTVKKSLPCGVYADGSLRFGSSGEFFQDDKFHMNASATDFCLNDEFDASGILGPGLVMGNVLLPGGSSNFEEPQQEGWSIRNFYDTGPAEVPTFKFTDPANYDVDLSDFDQWDHLGRCYVKVPADDVNQFVRRGPFPTKQPRLAQASILPVAPLAVDRVRQLIGGILPASYSRWLPTPSMDFAAPPQGFQDEEEQNEENQGGGFVPNPINNPDGGNGGNGGGDGDNGGNDQNDGNPGNGDNNNNQNNDNNQDNDNQNNNNQNNGNPPQEPEYVFLPIAKAMRTQGSNEADIRWSNSDQPVCVWPQNFTNPQNGGLHLAGFVPDGWGQDTAQGMVVTDAGDTVIDNSSGMIRYKDGSPISIYSSFGTGDVIIGGFGRLRGIKGGLYVTGDIKIEMPGDGVNGSDQDYWFKGNKNKLGGLALWAEGTIDSDHNGDHDESQLRMVRGIMGTTNGKIMMNSSQEGEAPNINGILISGDDLSIEHFDQPSTLIHNKNAYDKTVLNHGDWEIEVAVSSTMPDYANTNVNIIKSRSVDSFQQTGQPVD